jgi:hypothetical protein
MKGIIVTKEQLNKIPAPILARLIIDEKDENFVLKKHGYDGEKILGEAICHITRQPKIPILKPNGKIRFIYPIWEGETVDE